MLDIFVIALCSATGAQESFWFFDEPRAIELFRRMADSAKFAESNLYRFNMKFDGDTTVERLEESIREVIAEKTFVSVERRVVGSLAPADKDFTYQTAYWLQVTDEMRGLEEGFRQHLIELALPTQIAYNDLMVANGGNASGVECKSSSREAWAFVSPNVDPDSSRYPFRLNTFDARGFCGHMAYKTEQEAVECMVSSYPVPDKGALDRVSASREWLIGQKCQEERDRLAQGVISYQTYLERCAEHNESALEVAA